MTNTKRTLRATFTEPPKGHEARVPDTPMVGAGSLIARHRAAEGKGLELVEAISVRTFYASRGSGMQPVRACVWIRAPRGSDGLDWLSGRGSAGGCGYHKESQAIADAVSSCGVRLFGKPGRYGGSEPADLKRPFHFGGTGASGYEEIFSEIARARGFRGPFLWISHGL